MHIFSTFDDILNENTALIANVVKVPMPTKDYSMVSYESLPSDVRRQVFYLKEAFNTESRDKRWYSDQLRRLKQVIAAISELSSDTSDLARCQYCGMYYPKEFLIAVKSHISHDADSVRPLAEQYLCPACFHQHM